MPYPEISYHCTDTDRKLKYFLKKERNQRKRVRRTFFRRALRIVCSRTYCQGLCTVLGSLVSSCSRRKRTRRRVEKINRGYREHRVGVHLASVSRALSRVAATRYDLEIGERHRNGNLEPDRVDRFRR